MKDVPLTYTDSGTVRNENYLVDIDLHPTTTTFFDGPEPLSTMLDGVNYGLGIILNKTVPGDLMGAIGFDSSAELNERRFAPAAPGTASYQALQRITDIANVTTATLTERVQNHIFFPRLDSGANIPEALIQAFYLLQNAPNATLAENFVVLFTDGLSNCTLGRTCGTDELSVRQSIADAQQIIDSYYYPHRIKLHVMLMGQETRPHTRLMVSPEDRTMCLSDEDARALNPIVPFTNFANNPAFFPTPGALAYDAAQDADYQSALMKPATLPRVPKYYFWPNKLYESAQTLGGVWAPIRPACKVGVDDRGNLDAACGSYWSTLSPAAQAANTSLPVLVPGTPGLLMADATPYVDPVGRLICDPAGRDKRQQVRGYMDQVLARSPYVIVKE